MKKGLIALCVLLVAAIIWAGVSTSQKNAITSELDSVKAEVTTISASLKQAQEELANAKAATEAAVEAAKAEAQTTIDTMTAEKTQLEGKITELNDQINLVTAENAGLKDNLEGVTEIIRSALALIDGTPAEEVPEENAEAPETAATLDIEASKSAAVFTEYTPRPARGVVMYLVMFLPTETALLPKFSSPAASSSAVGKESRIVWKADESLSLKVPVFVPAVVAASPTF